MARILTTKSIYYNDCNLIAQRMHSDLKSRSDIPRELSRIFVSPMESVVGSTFAQKASELGLSVCLHRFCDPLTQLQTFKTTNSSNVYVSIGLNDWDRVSILRDYATNWVIDCANGYMIHLIEPVIDRLIEEAKINTLIIGNIHTSSGVKLYEKYENRDFNLFFRTGIAGGAACATSDMSGINRGQITEIIECSETADQVNNFKIMADGGVKNGNYAAKAFGAGCEAIMMGSYFAQSLEAETHIIGDGTYWGGASHKQQERYGGKKKHSEGKVYKIESELKPLGELVNELWGGLSSTVSYTGYKTLTDFIGNGVFEIKQNSLPPGDRR